MSGKAEITGLHNVCLDVVYPHVFGHPEREVGGVLLGRASRSSWPLVTGAIPAIQATQRRDSLTFTQDAWEHIHRELEAKWEGDQIVGWYHSHPGFGIFLSEHDLFIHRNFFSGPSQIALVVDPHATTEGVFVWHQGQVATLYERPTAVRPSGLQSVKWLPNVPREAAPEPVAADAGSFRLAAFVAALLLGVLIGLGAWQLLPFSDRGSDEPAVIQENHRHRGDEA